LRQIRDMTKQQAKQFAKIYIGQLFYDHTFDKDEIVAPDEDKDLMEVEINNLLCRMLGVYDSLSPQEIYDICNDRL